MTLTEIEYVRAWATSRADAVRDTRRERSDAGASIVETVVIISLFVAAAIVIVGILVMKAKTAATNVKTQ